MFDDKKVREVNATTAHSALNKAFPPARGWHYEKCPPLIVPDFAVFYGPQYGKVGGHFVLVDNG